MTSNYFEPLFQEPERITGRFQTSINHVLFVKSLAKIECYSIA